MADQHETKSPSPGDQQDILKAITIPDQDETNIPSAAGGNWPAPRCVTRCAAKARPGYDSMDASEYMDSPRVLREKVKVLAAMLRKSGATVVYTGAGISRASGTPDYASIAKDTRAPIAHDSGNRLQAQPTFSHKAIASLQRKKLIHHWLDQNHDRLALKAGFPKAMLNEIHGAWGDTKNRVKMMDDNLRGDLIQWMQHWEACAEICVAMGTSLCGMYSDCIAEATAERKGLVIINLQRTRLDDQCALRIYGVLDEVLKLLADALKCRVPNGRCQDAGVKWQQKHPQCRCSTPKRKASDPK